MDEAMNSRVADAVYQFRTRDRSHRMTQGEAASAIGISRAKVYQIEKAQGCDVGTLLKVADWLGVGLDELLGRETAAV